MSSPPGVVCREVFDELSQPSAEEISDYAVELGIDPEHESHLLPLARDGLMQALPRPWKAYYDDKQLRHYYFNEDTKKTQWEHPVDHVYRQLVRKARDASAHDDTCASIQELPTHYEEFSISKQSNPGESKQNTGDDGAFLQSDTNFGAGTNSANNLRPLSGRPPIAPTSRTFEKKLSDLKISPMRSSIDSSLPYQASKKTDKLANRMNPNSEVINLKINVLNMSNQEDEKFNMFPNSVPAMALPLTGKGIMFSKTNKTDMASPDTETSLPFDSKSDPLKGILRDKVFDASNIKELELVPRQASSGDDDKKIVRFNLEQTATETAISPSSNSSSEQNEGQSSIISNSKLLGDTPLASPVNAKTVENPNTAVTMRKPNTLHGITLQPLTKLTTAAPLPVLPPLSLDSMTLFDNSKDSEQASVSPKRRVIRPPATDYIKPDLFKKNFQKISDLVKPSDVNPVTGNLLDTPTPEKDTRPRSPMIPQKNKISINLMESIDSETSLDSPDKEVENLDLDDLSEGDNCDEDVLLLRDQKKVLDLTESEKTNNDIFERMDRKENVQKVSDESDESQGLSSDVSKNHSVSPDLVKNLDVIFKPSVKISPLVSQTPESRSPKEDISLKHDNTTVPSYYKPPLIKSPQSKTSSTTSINKNLTSPSSPRLDGVIISQGKALNGRPDDVVIMYQFENLRKSPSSTLKHFGEGEKKELDDSEIKDLAQELKSKDKTKRLELEKELKVIESKYEEERTMRIKEINERHKRDLELALQESERSHQAALEAAAKDRERRFMHETERAEFQFRNDLLKLRNEFQTKLDEERKHLQFEYERAVTEFRDQLIENIGKERNRILEENRAILETLRQTQAERVAELKHDYRAEIKRLRTQHDCHLEELRTRLASERTAASRRAANETHSLADKYKCLKEKYAILKHDVKLSIERRNKRRQMSATTGSETDKSNSNKVASALDKSKEVNETATNQEPLVRPNNNPVIKYTDNETSQSESNMQKSTDNNNDCWKNRKGDNSLLSPATSQTSGAKSSSPHNVRPSVVFREPPKRKRDKMNVAGALKDCQESSDATTADDNLKEFNNGQSRRRRFSRLKSASTSRLNYSPKRGESWTTPLESLRQQLRKLDDLEDQFPDLACQPSYSLRYPFTELGAVSSADSPELEFVRHRALVEREGMRRARAVLRRRRAALRESQASVSSQFTPVECTTEISSDSEMEMPPSANDTEVLRSLRELHEDVRDLCYVIGSRKSFKLSPDVTISMPLSPQPRHSISPRNTKADSSEEAVAEKARDLRAWLRSP